MSKENQIFDSARDELFSHIHRCGVLKAIPEHQADWMDDTMGFLRERYPTLTPAETRELREIGLRFCQPAIPHGGNRDAATKDEEAAA